ncbi:hypothetical protein P8V03_15935 [Clostridium sp. A1-XYC3]|uniref:Phage protein n=1 Tax=Clostridium tanneri TaxID=3037988 RepID=A0ABU4JWW6_9CLOT|nr:hypothetical protein [Clostridium sp. A1-XYC3]MDW8802638.1 hypothetical protein [Clostridium sp. A1-XYC3]
MKLLKTVFVTDDGKEFNKEQLTDEEYQYFCDEFEKSRIKHKVNWPELDDRYKRKK